MQTSAWILVADKDLARDPYPNGSERLAEDDSGSKMDAWHDDKACSGGGFSAVSAGWLVCTYHYE